MDYYAVYTCVLGDLLLVSDGHALTGLYLGKDVSPRTTDLPVFAKTAKWLDAYFQGKEEPIDFPLNAKGTAFQQRVWEILKTIPFGETRTYGSIARHIAREMGKEKMSAQAVGQAVGRNPVSIIVPCHRCMGANGKLTGYESGLHNKKWLLQHEGWDADQFTE